MKLVDLINEINYSVYQGMIRVTYAEDSSINEISDLFRALPGVTILTQAGHNEGNNTAVFKIKVVSTKSGQEAFEHVKQLALTKIPPVKRVEIGTQTIEKK